MYLYAHRHAQTHIYNISNSNATAATAKEKLYEIIQNNNEKKKWEKKTCKENGREKTTKQKYFVCLCVCVLSVKPIRPVIASLRLFFFFCFLFIFIRIFEYTHKHNTSYIVIAVRVYLLQACVRYKSKKKMRPKEKWACD